MPLTLIPERISRIWRAPDLVIGFVGVFALCHAFVGLALGISLFNFLWWLLGLPTVTLWTAWALYFAQIALSDAHETGSSEWPWFKRLRFWRHCSNYFPITTIADDGADLMPEQVYLFACYPHGVINATLPEMLFTESAFAQKFPGQQPVAIAATIVFRIPVLREILLWCGFRDANRHVIASALRSGRSVAILPGGEAELLLSETGRERVVVVNRMGFVRLAMQYGIPIVPVFTFGLNDWYQTWGFCSRLRRFIQKRFRIAIPLFCGRWYAPLVMHRSPITICVGKPIEVPHPLPDFAEPAAEDVVRVHAQFVTELTSMYERNKNAHGRADRELECIPA
eukprot:m.39132 g.39132  ORF g.39132 m.39132 type:complete len:339 (-) comp5928_c0_seq1:47-1063(-)